MEDTFICTSKTQSDCKDEFFEANPHLEYHYVKSDGNCFFRSLAKYYELTGETLRGVRNPTDHEELRAFIVRHFGELVRRDPEVMGFLRAGNQRPLGEILSELGRSCVWNVHAFEIMMPQVARILNINVVIYRVDRPPMGKKDYSVSRTIYTPPNGPAATTISIFLALNHYGLVFPRGSSSVESQHVSQQAAQASNSSNSIMKMMRNLNEQNALNVAFAASMNQMRLNQKNNTKKKMNNYNVEAALAASLNQMRLNNRRRNNENAAMNVALAASMKEPNSEPIGLTVENVQGEFPYKTTTIAEIKSVLDTYGVKYSQKAKKEELYGILMITLLNLKS